MNKNTYQNMMLFKINTHDIPERGIQHLTLNEVYSRAIWYVNVRSIWQTAP